VLHALEKDNLLGGHALDEHYPELGDAILVCATETKTTADLNTYAAHLRRIMN
jgi:glycine dehydrogenase subunit 1